MDSKSLQSIRMYRQTAIPSTSHKNKKVLGFEVLQNCRDAFLQTVTMDGSIQQEYNKINRVIGYAALLSLIELGFNFAKGSKITAKSGKIKFSKLQIHLVNRLLEMIAADGYLTSTTYGNYIVVKESPSPMILRNLIRKESKEDGILQYEWKVVNIFNAKTKAILLGEEDPLRLLFPKSKDEFSVIEFYHKSYILKESNACFGSVIHTIVEKLQQSFSNNSKDVLKVIEIGAGTGSSTTWVLDALEQLDINFEYTYTDISPAFFREAEKKFCPNKGKMIFKAFDAEKDPRASDFPIFNYDVVIANNVLHATSKLAETLKNMRLLLRSGGIIGMLETFTPQRLADLTVGHLEGYWRFLDSEVRKHHCCVDGKVWEGLLKDAGFDETLSLPMETGGYGVVIAEAGEVRKIPENLETIRDWVAVGDLGELVESTMLMTNVGLRIGNVRNLDLGNILERYPNTEGLIIAAHNFPIEENFVFKVLEDLKQLKIQLKVIVLTRNACKVLEDDEVKPEQALVHGLCRSLLSKNVSLKTIDVDTNSTNEGGGTEWAEILLKEMWNFENEDVLLAYRNKNRFGLRLDVYNENENKPYQDLSIPWERFCLLVPSNKTVGDLSFNPTQEHALSPTEVEVKVEAHSLGFKNTQEILSSFEVNKYGGDISGIISRIGGKVTSFKVGDPVFGFSPQELPLSSHAVIEEKLLLRLPSSLTFAEGSVIPSAFYIAYHSLIEIASVGKNDTVLIHTACSGIGLMAIQLAKSRGCNLIVTAGSKKKRSYLKEILGLGHLFNSRDLEFAKKVMEITEGKGVQVVLNTLKGQGLREASLSCCAEKSRFIDLAGKWSQTEVEKMKGGVRYSALNMSNFDTKSISKWNIMLSKMLEKGEALSQITTTTIFQAQGIRNAFTTIQNGNNIGRTVCTFGKQLFNDRSSYLILSDIMSVESRSVLVNWFVHNGARFIIFVQQKAEGEVKVNKLDNSGMVATISCNFSNLEEFKSSLKEVETKQGFPAVKGVTLLRQESFFVKEKINSDTSLISDIIDFLHLVSSNLNLDHFLLLSSNSSLLDDEYSIFLDGFANYRQSLGLPAISLTWNENELTLPQVLPTLEKLLSSSPPPPILMTKEGPENLLITHKWAGKYLENVMSKNDGGERSSSDSHPSKADDENSQSDFLIFLDSLETEKEKRDFIAKNVWETFCSIIHCDPSPFSDFESPDAEISVLDSLMRIEFANVLQDIIGPSVEISSSILDECENVGQIRDKVFLILNNSALTKKSSFNAKVLANIIRADCTLWDTIKIEKGNIPPCPISKIRTILMTGTTGMLGPAILKEVLEKGNIALVYCLVRPRWNYEKLCSYLKQFRISAEQLKKIRIVHGDLALNFLGMSTQDYDKLSSEVDCVFHGGALTDHLDEYKVSWTLDDVRSVNVIGTQRVLEFTVKNRTKHLFVASTIGAILDNPNLVEELSDDWADISEYDDPPNFGYATSKFVKEQLIKQAVEKVGIPCKAFRYPIVCGDSTTGEQDVLKNHFFSQIVHYFQAGIMPNVDIPVMACARDICAKISTEIFFNEDAPIGVYNVVNDNCISEFQLLPFAKELGIDIQIVDYGKFTKHLKDCDKSFALYHLKEYYLDKDRYLKFVNKFKVLEGWRRNKEKYFWNEKARKYVKNYEKLMEDGMAIVKRDLMFAIKQTDLFKKEK